MARLLSTLAAGAIVAAPAVLAQTSSPLQPLAFFPLKAGSIRPTGWLFDEFMLHATGLPGMMNEFWEPLNNSQWLGGTSTFEDWGEIGPYIFDGAAALACALQDAEPRIFGIVGSWMDYLVTHQKANGTIGPEGSNDFYGMWYWQRWPAVKAMLQWADCTGDKRMYPAIMAWQHEAYARLQDPQWPLGYTWQGVRWQDWVHINQMLIDFYAPASDVPFLMELSSVIYAQALQAGVDWERHWYVDGWFPTDAVPGNVCNLTNHGVNTGQSIKSGAILYRQTGNALGIASSYKRWQLLTDYHGVPSGMFQADEHLAGNMPSHGTETCAVVETMFSLNVVFEALGDPFFADMAEHILYNAMPGAMTKDIWTRVYLQSSNEIAAVPQDPHVWISDGPDSFQYGLDLNYACCTSTMGTGFPKSLQRAVHAAPDGGPAITIYGPLTASMPNGVLVNVTTDYPFDDNITVTLTNVPSNGTNLYLRIPSWATDALLYVNGGAPLNVGAVNGSMYRVPVPATGGVPFSVLLATQPQVTVDTWYAGAVAVRRGAFVYSLQLGELFAPVTHYALNSSDYNVTLAPNATWNVALVLDPTEPGKYLSFARTGGVPPVPFSAQAPPVSVAAQAVAVFAWTPDLGQPAAPPASPVDCTAGGACSAVMNVTLVPFGTTHLRMTELPYVLPQNLAAARAGAGANAVRAGKAQVQQVHAPALRGVHGGHAQAPHANVAVPQRR